MRQRILYLIIFVALLVGVWFWIGDRVVAPVGGDATEVAYDPIQCQGNPWEEDWLLAHPNDPNAQEYVKAHDLSLFKAYYEREADVEIFEVKKETVHQAVCLACSCPRGDRLTVTVAAEDVAKLLEMGFKNGE